MIYTFESDNAVVGGLELNLHSFFETGRLPANLTTVVRPENGLSHNTEFYGRISDEFDRVKAFCNLYETTNIQELPQG